MYKIVVLLTLTTIVTTQEVLISPWCGLTWLTTSPNLTVQPFNVTIGKCPQPTWTKNKQFKIPGTAYVQKQLLFSGNDYYGSSQVKGRALNITWITKHYGWRLEFENNQRENSWIFTTAKSTPEIKNKLDIGCKRTKTSDEDWIVGWNVTKTTQIFIYNWTDSSNKKWSGVFGKSWDTDAMWGVVHQNPSPDLFSKHCVFDNVVWWEGLTKKTQWYPCAGPLLYCGQNYRRTNFSLLLSKDDTKNKSALCAEDGFINVGGLVSGSTEFMKKDAITCLSAMNQTNDTDVLNGICEARPNKNTTCAPPATSLPCPTCPSRTQCISPATNSGVTSMGVTNTILTTIGLLINNAKGVFGNFSAFNLTTNDNQCHYYCQRKHCSGSNGHGCAFWCDGKLNHTGLCNNFCYTWQPLTKGNNSHTNNTNPYVKCMHLGWNPLDIWLYKLETIITLQIFTIVISLFGLLFWAFKYKWYRFFPWLLRTIICFQPRGQLFYNKKYHTKQFRSTFTLGTSKFTTTNCIIIMLLFILTCGRVRPTVGVTIGPNDFGREFSNGSLVFNVLTGYSWYNLTSHNGHQVCFKHHVEKHMSAVCCSSRSCSVPGLNADCTKRSDPQVCAASHVTGGGWPHGCFCFGTNSMAGACKIWCNEPADVYDLSQMHPNNSFAVQVQYKSNQTIFHFNRTGTHSIKLNDTDLNITISGCIGEPPPMMAFVRNYSTPPIDPTGCARYKDRWLQEQCSLFVWYGYNSGSVECHAPQTCKYKFFPLNGKRTHHSWEHFLTCDFQFKWTEEKCTGNSEGTLVGCMGNTHCLVEYKNCTHCCNNGEGVLRNHIYDYGCTDCTYNGTKWNGTILENHYKVDSYVSREVTWSDSAWGFITNLFGSVISWFGGFGIWRYPLIIAMCVVMIILMFSICRK